jgi:hypothetical protein
MNYPASLSIEIEPLGTGSISTASSGNIERKK